MPLGELFAPKRHFLPLYGIMHNLLMSFLCIMYIFKQNFYSFSQLTNERFSRIIMTQGATKLFHSFLHIKIPPIHCLESGGLLDMYRMGCFADAAPQYAHPQVRITLV